jgi:hypothetical protein
MFGARNSNLLHRITIPLIICYLVTVVLCVHTAAALPGSGTQQDPWRIESLADFDEFAADPNYWSGFTRLETDVNLAGRTYTKAVIAPDVNNSNSDIFDGTAFTGVFDGNDHKIINLTIDDGGAGNDSLGLFGCIDGGEVRNLGIEGASVSGDDCVGVLMGANGGSVLNCYSTGDVNGVSCVGGLVGLNCYVFCVLPVCVLSPGYIYNSYSTGSASGDEDVGGLVGGNNGDISNCYSTGSVSWTGSYSYSVGGFVGINYEGSISNCHSTGDVNGVSCVGGFVGVNHKGSISNCHSTGDVNGVSCVGGLSGNNERGSVSNCYSTGSVNGTSDVGGLVGINEDAGNISNCYSTGSVNGGNCVGGLVGINYYSYSISNSYSTGDVNGVSRVGGLVGDNMGSVSNCYATGFVIGEGAVGGLVGRNGFSGCQPPGCFQAPGYIYNSYSIGSVQGDSLVGGLVGYNLYGDIESSFWDVETSGEPNMCGGQYYEATGCDPNCGKTTAEMQTMSTFADAGWDFVEIWGIGENQTYPYLRFAPAGDLNYDKKVDLLDLAILASHWLEKN